MDILRVQDLKVCDFERNFLDAEVPVIIENFVENWPASKWDLNVIKKKAGHNKVFVRRNTAGFEYKVGRKYNIESMTFHEYIENIEADDPKAKSSYLAVQNIKKSLPELNEDINVPCYVRKLHAGPYLWVARKGHYEFCHFDPDDNLLIVFYGSKRVKLYKACDIDRLYPNPLGSNGRTIQSQVFCNESYFEDFPKFRGIESYQCTLNPGDMLYFPAFWWHQVTSTETTISMNIFFGDDGTNKYLTKIMNGLQWPSFKYWLLNIVEQNRRLKSFEKVLQYLPDSLCSFLMKQWHEVPTSEQLEVLVAAVIKHCALSELPERTVKVNHPPVLKIRGLLWRS